RSFGSRVEALNTHIKGVDGGASTRKPTGEATGAAGAPASAPPSAEPSVAPSEEPSLAPPSSTSPAAGVVAISSDVPESASHLWMLWAAIAVVVVLGAAAPFGWRRLRKPGEPRIGLLEDESQSD